MQQIMWRKTKVNIFYPFFAVKNIRSWRTKSVLSNKSIFSLHVCRLSVCLSAPKGRVVWKTPFRFLSLSLALSFFFSAIFLIHKYFRRWRKRQGTHLFSVFYYFFFQLALRFFFLPIFLVSFRQNSSGYDYYHHHCSMARSHALKHPPDRTFHSLRASDYRSNRIIQFRNVDCSVLYA